MICKGCGKKVDINKKFCTNCGWKIEDPVVTEEEVKKIIPKEPVKKEIKTSKNSKVSSENIKSKTVPLSKIIFLWIFGSITLGGLIFYSYELDNNQTNKASSKVTQWINNGKYSFDSNGIDIDVVHLNSFGAITYEASIREDKSNVDDEYFYDYKINVACSSGEIYSWEDNKWITPKTKNKKSLVKAICKEKDNDPAIIPLLISSGWKKYSNDHWVNIDSWEEDDSTVYKDFDTNYYTTSDQELSEISVDCSDDAVALVKKGEWTKYKKAKGIFKEILNDKCDSISSSQLSNFNDRDVSVSSEIRELDREDGTSVVFNPNYIATIGWGDEFRIHKTLKYFYWLKENPSKQYASYVRCKGYKGIFEEDGGLYNTDESRGWVRFKLKKTPAQKEGLLIANEFCPKRTQINQSVWADQGFSDWDEKVLRF